MFGCCPLHVQCSGGTMSEITFNGCSHPLALAPLSSELFGIKATESPCTALGLAKVVTVGRTFRRKSCVGLRTWRSRFTSTSLKSALEQLCHQINPNSVTKPEGLDGA